MKNSELLRKLRKAGFNFYKQGKGSHEIWRNDKTGIEVTVTNHGSKEVGPPAAGAEKILKDAGIR